MKFAHIADCHIGGWKDERMSGLGIKTFELAIKECISRNVDFILLSGDLFNTALPGIDYIKEAARLLKKAKDAGINIYTIAGSHDYSLSGKTILDVMENAGLVSNVAKFDEDGLKFTVDKKTNAKITGLYGKKGGLEKFDYENLNKTFLERENGFKIFMFHSGIKEFMPSGMEEVESMPSNMLPGGFNYYAGGHIHYIFQKKNKDSLLMFPGALFPNNFKELEEYKCGGFYIVNENLDYEYVKLKLKDIINIDIDANEKNPEMIMDEISRHKDSARDKIIMIRIYGVLKDGKPSDISFKQINELFSEAYCIIKNTSKLTSKEFKVVDVKETNIAEIESSIVRENLENIRLFGPHSERDVFVNELINLFSLGKQEGEKNYTFEEKIIKDATKFFAIEKNDNQQNKVA